MSKLQQMLSLPVRLLAALFFAITLFAINGCSAEKASLFSPYRMEMVQGNFISQEQVVLIEPGMSQSQVRTILGTPLLEDIFHPDRWDYTFLIKRKGLKPLERRLTVYFEDEMVSSIDLPEEMLTEDEFILYLAKDKDDESYKVRALQATPEQLKKAAEAAEAYRKRERDQARDAADGHVAPTTDYYPPLD